MTDRASNLVPQLVTLRWCACIGQAAAVVIADRALGLTLDRAALAGGVVALVLFNIWVTLQVRRGYPFDTAQAVWHLAMDIAVLSWLIAWSGGAMNPFTSLLLLPVALAAVALPFRAVVLTAVLAASGYALVAVFGRPLPHSHVLTASVFDLHLAGMAVNFVVSALTVTWFVSRLALALTRRDAEVARLRERFARDEGIVALATQAASVAHELNTPLASMTLLLEDLRDGGGDPASRQDDVALLSELVETCRLRVRALSVSAAEAPPRPLANALVAVVEAWTMLRPTIELRRDIDLSGADDVVEIVGVGHLLQVLLDNAADASLAIQRSEVDLSLRITEGVLVGSVRDHGTGLADELSARAGQQFITTKADGLGMGLVLSHATVERLGGTLMLEPATGGGTVARFRMPLPIATGSAS